MDTIYKRLIDTGFSIRQIKEDVAVEIEAEFRVHDNMGLVNQKTWMIKDDGSLRGYGKEYITRHPTSFRKLKSDIKELFETEPFTKDYLNSDRTSTHVHVNVQNWTLEKLIKVLMVYYACEPYLAVRFAGPEREGNHNCLQMYQADEVMKAVELVVDGNWKELMRQFNNYKYAALNIASVARIGSIEFRQMRGSNNYKIVEEWLDVIQNIIRFAESFRLFEDIWKSASENLERFIQQAIGNTRQAINTFEYDQNLSYVFVILNFVQDSPKRLKIKGENPYEFTKEYLLDYINPDNAVLDF